MLTIKTKQQLRRIGIQASHSNDFASGLKLMQLVNQIFYNGDNQILANKLKVTDQRKTGNNVLNINMIMNYLKKDPTIQLSEFVKQLNTFTILEDQQTMIQLVQEILTYHSQRGSGDQEHFKVDGDVQDMSPPKQQDNQFQNLYFVSSLDKKNNVLDDSLQEENPQQKVVRKGSFKVLKPKAHTASKVPSEESERGGFYRTEQKEQVKQKKQPLKQILIETNQMMENEEKDDLHCRKTIPKMYQKPPLYRTNIPKPQKSTIKMEPAPELTARRPKEELLKNIQSLNKQIIEEQKSINLNERQTSVQKRSIKSSKKIFKIDIPETDDKKKKILLEWLISINLLNSNSTKFIHQLHEICKDGVVFVQIVNYYKGRGKQLYYFRQPKRSAQLHSNYQKLFATLSEHINFQSLLLHQFEYFIPEAQPNAFWHLLSCIHQCYNKRVLPRQTNLNRYENSISRKVDRQQSKRKNTNQSTSYKQIKYNSSQKDIKSNSSSVQVPRKQTPTPKRAISRRSQQNTQKSFVPYGLIQNQQPSEDFHNRTERGYRELYLNKFKNIQTPHKNRSFSNSSLSKQRSKMTFVNSSKKKEHKPLVPSINLQMQMKVLSYIQDLTPDEDVVELFKDPFRNGVLLCMAVRKHLGIQCVVNRKPKNIQDCRNNLYTAIELIKSHKQYFNSAYQAYIQDLLKGQKTLLYGLIWQLIKDEKDNKNTSFSIYNKKGSNQQDAAVTWIRSLQRCYPPIGQFKIRNESTLLQVIVGTDFLFHYSWFITSKKAITPTYEHPINHIQKQSNLKKVLSYLIQNKIVRSDYLWKTKSLIKNQNDLLKELVNDLMNHYNHLYKKEQIRSVNFVKFAKRQDSQSKEKYKEKLQTTMANHSMPQPQPRQVLREQVKIEVPWMRKLGFTGSLDLNNGVILCRLLTKFTMKTIQGFHQKPQSRAQSLGNIRKAIKLIPKFRWDEYDILNGDSKSALQIYSFLKDKYKHSYAMKGI